VTGAPAVSFETIAIALPSGPAQYWVGGTGKPLLYLHGAGGARPSAALERLAASRRVYLPLLPGLEDAPASGGMRATAELAAAFIAATGTLPCDVAGYGVGGGAAAWLAASHPGAVGHLVLLAPATESDLLDRLGDIKAPTLILHGTRDTVTPRDGVRLLKARIARSHLVYVFDAGHAIETDQPERVALVTQEFLARGEAFIVNRSGNSAA
jgi:pimeloyl-ACP methyl ester carboxylesterase